MARDDHDPEIALRPRQAEDLGPLFAPEPQPHQVPVTDKIAVKYATWRLTPDGKTAFDWIERLALQRLVAGERRTGAKYLVELARDALHLQVDNKYSCMIGRELVLRHPQLKDQIELRVRTAA